MIAPLIPTSAPHPALCPSQERRGLPGLRGQRQPRRNEPRVAALRRMAPGILQRAADRWESPAPRLSPPYPARRSVMDKYLQSHDWDRAFTLNCQLHHLHSLVHGVLMKYFMAERERES